MIKKTKLAEFRSLSEEFQHQSKLRNILFLLLFLEFDIIFSMLQNFCLKICAQAFAQF